MKNVLHMVGLRAYGGLEQLFIAYLGAMANSAHPPPVILKHTVHPDFRTRMHGYTGRVYREKYRGRFRLPNLRIVRQRHLHGILAANTIDKVVFWGRLPTGDWISSCRRYGARMIYYDHGRAWLLDRATNGGPLSHVDAAITVSEAGKRILRERLGFPGPIEVVPNGVRFPTPEQVPAKLETDTLRIGFAGRLVDNKGLPVLLWAAKTMAESGTDFQVFIAGDGPSRVPMTELARQLDVDERVRFLGEVRDMRKFYEGIDILVMPSLRESFGLTPIEAANYGVPAIVSRVDGLAEAIVHGETGFSLPTTLPMSAYLKLGGGWHEVPEQVYDPDKDELKAPAIIPPQVLANLLCELASQKDRLRAMGLRGIDYVQAQFSMSRYVERLNAALAD